MITGERLMVSSEIYRFIMDGIREAAERSKKASYQLPSIPLELRNKALSSIADGLVARKDAIIAANAIDLKNATETGLAIPLVKRLLYDEHKIEESVLSIRSIMTQEDVIGKLLSKIELDTGLILEKVSCPIGVIGVVFESRPDALVQISALCLRSGNTVLLKGGSEAKETNEVLAEIIDDAIVSVDKRFECSVQLLSTREEFRRLLELDDLVDLIIPRGSNELVRSIKGLDPHPGPWACGWHLSYICR